MWNEVICVSFQIFGNHPIHVVFEIAFGFAVCNAACVYDSYLITLFRSITEAKLCTEHYQSSLVVNASNIFQNFFTQFLNNFPVWNILLQGSFPPVEGIFEYRFLMQLSFGGDESFAERTKVPIAVRVTVRWCLCG